MQPLRTFKEWSFQEVEPVVRMLYEKQPFDLDERPEHWRRLQWKRLVRRRASTSTNCTKRTLQ